MLIERDISSEQWREVLMKDFSVIIDKPVKLMYREGGSTHRVVTETGVVYCYPAPETGKAIITWKSKDGLPEVAF